MRRPVSAGLAAVALLAACSPSADSSVTTTNDAAHAQTIRYIQKIADALPTGAVLSSALPGNANAVLKTLPGPCDDDDDNPEQPYYWSMNMWVLAPPAVSVQQAEVSILDDWQQRDYSIKHRDNGDVQSTTNDGWTL